MANGYAASYYETTPGNESTAPSTSTKVIFFPLKGLSLTPGVDPFRRDDELRNQSDVLAMAPGNYSPSGVLNVPCYPDTVGYLLKWILGAPTSTTSAGATTDPDGGTIPTGLTKHVWTSPGGPAGTSPQTARLIASWKDVSQYAAVRGAACSSLEFQLTDKEIMLSAALVGLFMDDAIVDPALTATYESLSVLPFKMTGVTVPTWLSGSDKAFNSLSWRIDNPVDPARTMTIASLSPDVMDKGDEPVSLSGDAEFRHLDPQDVAALRAHTGFASKIKCLSESVAGSGYKYTLWVEMSNTQYESGEPGDLENKRIIGNKVGFRATNAGSAAFTITLVNLTGSYA